MPHRFYHLPPLPAEPIFALPNEVFHHAVTVLRLRVGDECALFDGLGMCGQAVIECIDKKSAQARWSVSPTIQTTNESPLDITLAQCLSSAEKMDWTVEKAVELGVNRIVPLFSQKSQVKLSSERADKKMEHWTRLIRAACAQSGRNRCPSLSSPQPLTEWLNRAIRTDTNPHNADIYSIILHPEHDNPQRLSQLPAPTDRQQVVLLIGPESGFSVQEYSLARSVGFIAATLGRRILRTETAGLATVAAMQALWGDF